MNLTSKQVKELRWKNIENTRKIVKEFKDDFLSSEINKKWSKVIRENYLDSRIKSLTNLSKKILESLKEYKKTEPPEWLFKITVEMCGIKEFINKIKKHKNELMMKEEDEKSKELIKHCRDIQINTLVKIIKFGDPEFAICPIHKDTDPSFAIYSDNTWYCFGCKAHGSNAIDFIMQRDKIPFNEAIKILKECI